MIDTARLSLQGLPPGLDREKQRMLDTDDQWIQVADSFTDAAMNGDGWYQALELFAQATGSEGGQLIGIGTAITIPFNTWTIDPEIAAEFDELGFSRPALNPRVRAGMAAGPGRVIAEADFITPEQIRADEHYKWSRHRDVPYSCLSTLIAGTDSLIGLAVSRSNRDGHITPTQKQIFASLAPHVRTAVRTQMMLEGNTASLLTGTMEAMSLAAFACDHIGQVMAMTPQAEALLSSGRFLKLQLNCLTAELSQDSQALDQTIREAIAGLQRPGPPLMKSLFIRSLQGEQTPDTIIVDVISLPVRPFAFSFTPRALVLVRGLNRDDQQLMAALKAAFLLTDAEAQVAMQLANGQKPEDIADSRKVSVATIRSQIKSIYEKMGINRQGELVARLRPLQ